MIDTEKIEAAVRNDPGRDRRDPEREGLKDTPARVARMCKEIFAVCIATLERHWGHIYRTA